MQLTNLSGSTDFDFAKQQMIRAATTFGNRLPQTFALSDEEITLAMQRIGSPGYETYANALLTLAFHRNEDPKLPLVVQE